MVRTPPAIRSPKPHILKPCLSGRSSDRFCFSCFDRPSPQATHRRLRRKSIRCHSCPRNCNPMNPAAKRILKIAARTLIAMPLLSAVAGLLLGPTVLHPFRRRLTVRQIAQADQAFQGLNAIREDGILLGGWKVRASHPNGDWVLLLHGRSHNRSVMLPYAEFLLAARYSVVMMDARAHGNSGGSLSTYGQIEIFDTRAIVKNLATTEKVDHLFVIGESMGAAVSLQSAAFVPQIEGVVAEGAFRNLREVKPDHRYSSNYVSYINTLTSAARGAPLPDRRP
jgi:Serine aminopeptidase, S33